MHFWFDLFKSWTWSWHPRSACVVQHYTKNLLNKSTRHTLYWSSCHANRIHTQTHTPCVFRGSPDQVSLNIVHLNMASGVRGLKVIWYPSPIDLSFAALQPEFLPNEVGKLWKAINAKQCIKCPWILCISTWPRVSYEVKGHLIPYFFSNRSFFLQHHRRVFAYRGWTTFTFLNLITESFH